MRAHLIMAWLQQQPTRERPDTFTQAASDGRTKDLATPGQTIHFLQRYPSAWRCRASPRPTASSAWLLVLQRPQTLRVRYIEAAALGFPLVERGAADAMLAAHIGRLRPGLMRGVGGGYCFALQR